jgi:aromatic-L-amino-acid decarboxylase
MNTINNSGKAYFTHTKLNGQIVLRLSIGQTNTEMRHIEQVWQLIQKKAFEIESGTD